MTWRHIIAKSTDRRKLHELKTKNDLLAYIDFKSKVVDSTLVDGQKAKVVIDPKNLFFSDPSELEPVETDDKEHCLHEEEEEGGKKVELQNSDLRFGSLLHTDVFRDIVSKFHLEPLADKLGKLYGPISRKVHMTHRQERQKTADFIRQLEEFKDRYTEEQFALPKDSGRGGEKEKEKVNANDYLCVFE